MKRIFLCLLCACAINTIASAHVLDQYLQVAQISVAPDGARVELRLIPGVQVADRVFALVDVDGDERISAAEEKDYEQRVMQDVAFQVDGEDMPLALTKIEFPSREEMNEGVGAIRLNLTAETAFDAAGEHHLLFRNDHQPEIGVYLANVLVPQTDAIEITGQQRDRLQHEFRVNFRVLSRSDSLAPHRLTAAFLLLLCFFLALLLTQRKRLHDFFAV